MKKHYYAVAVYYPAELISLYDGFFFGPMRDYKFHRFDTRAGLPGIFGWSLLRLVLIRLLGD